RWIEEGSYGDLLALCQFLPGPASSQLGISIGLVKAGLPGALAAWLGFTTPSAIALASFAYGLTTTHADLSGGALHGLKIAAVAVVAQAVWSMAQRLCPDAKRATIAVLAAGIMLAWPMPLAQVALIGAGSVLGLLFLRAEPRAQMASLDVTVSPALAILGLLIFVALAAGLPYAASSSHSQTLALLDRFYRAGALVFGGGHVVLPLLQAAVVPPGWISNDSFLAGYGAAQAVPGPLFTFAAYLGAAMGPEPNGWFGALICLLAIFAPSFLLVIGFLPFWDRLRTVEFVQSALMGINAVVVGLLLAALYNPVWTSAISGPLDFALALISLLLLAVWRAPPWAVVIFAAVGGWAAPLLRPFL
ncbi:MAG TPA: chromate efflux transporter, partial [Alphaproteobacteria bacterium]|nr:chromate efflux transporter [Alphaproteobacteria bacterium]